MSFSDAAKMMNRAGIRPSVDLQSSALPYIRTRAELDRLRDQGLEEMDRYGQSLAYQQWMGLLARGADSSLVDLEIAGGGIPRTTEEQYQELHNASSRSTRYLTPEHLSPSLASMALDGVPITQWDVDSALTRTAELLAEAPPGPARTQLVNFYAQLESAPATSFNGIEVGNPEPENFYQINSDPDVVRHQDAYTAYRESLAMNQEHGLAGLRIRPQAYPDAMLSGIVRANPDGGGEYSASDDAYYQASIAQQSQSDFHQGDATNSFSE